MIVVGVRHVLAGFDCSDHLADAIDDREDGAYQRAVGSAASGAAIRESVLGRVAQRLEPRKLEKAAIAFDGVDEAKNAVEPSAVVGLSLPGNDFAAQRFEHFAAFGYEIGNQVVHRRNRPSALL
jgi:hypothetical protein